MNSSQPHSTPESHARANFGDHRVSPRSNVSWGAIFAGTVAALALHVLFMMLIGGLGLAIYSPLTEENPVADFSMGVVLIHSICVIISLCLGGWVAGRLSPVAARATGWLHGFSVWAAATVGGVILVALGAGAMLGGLTKIVGGGLSAVGQPLAEVAGDATDLAADAVKQSEDTITSFVDEAVSNLPEDGPADDAIRAEREVGMALGRLFNPMMEGDAEANRSAAVTALVDYTEMSESEADRTITEWTDTYDRLQADLDAFKETAAETALKAADSTAGVLAKISLWAFVGFLIGALAAAFGGLLGAKRAMSCEESGHTHSHDTAHDA